MYPIVPRVYPIVTREYPIVPRVYPIIAREYPIVAREYPSELLSSTPRGASAGRAGTGRTGAQQLCAAFAGADRVGVEVETIVVALVKVAAAWVGRIRLIAEVGLAGCRGRSLARRRVDDREIACRALIAPILAPRVACCTRRRRRSGSNLRTTPNRARCSHTLCIAQTPAGWHACDACHGYGCAPTCNPKPHGLRWPGVSTVGARVL